MSTIDFLKAFFKNPVNTGAVAPSSKKLGDLMVKSAKVSQANSIVEFGVGTGVFTEKIYNAKSPEATFIAIEINSKFMELTQKRCPQVTIYNDDASNVKKYLAKHNIIECDCIVSGLPWAGFPDNLQKRILHAAVEALKPGGIFVSFAYIHGAPLPRGKKFSELLSRSFSEVEKSPVIWANVPPAFTYICKK
ncbi:class I SAM-dependent methyltransferase [Candidatus Uabimicrobium sp. HlEnr_7]|uniref:class I SAM-dependent methyltransferase n=1 Tax=Candidatus Uabimicrobium helgolandensis TaxID=3095367 RepID=UPI003555D68B